MKVIYTILALIALIVMILAQFRLLNQRSSNFSARQLVAQGRAYKLALYAMISYTLFYAFLDVLGIVWCETVAGLLLGVIIGIGVFIMASIHFEAYGEFETNNTLWFYASLLIIILGIVSCVFSAIKGTFIIDKKLGFGACGMFMSLVWGAILIVQHYHYGFEEYDDEDEDEEEEE